MHLLDDAGVIVAAHEAGQGRYDSGGDQFKIGEIDGRQRDFYESRGALTGCGARVIVWDTVDEYATVRGNLGIGLHF